MTEPAAQNTDSELDRAIGELLAARTDSRWHRVEVVASTGSTNADLAARAADPDAADGLVGTVRITTDQTAGRGRRERVWTAPAGGQLAISVVLPAGEHTDRLGWLSLATGVAAATAIDAQSGVRPVLKWPNDVLIGDKKVAGILAEYVATPSGGVVIVGAGLNTNLAADDLPVPTATSLAIETGAPLDTAAVARLGAAYLTALSDLDWPNGIDHIAQQYRSRCDTVGRRVRLELPGDRVVVGTAVDVDDSGRIVIADDAGGRMTAAAGDVVHLRPIAG